MALPQDYFLILYFSRGTLIKIILKNVTAAGLHKIILERSEKGSTFKQYLLIYQIKNNNNNNKNVYIHMHIFSLRGDRSMALSENIDARI